MYMAISDGSIGGRGALALPPTILVKWRRPSKEFLDVHVDLATHVVYTLCLDAVDTAVQSYVYLTVVMQ